MIPKVGAMQRHLAAVTARYCNSSSHFKLQVVLSFIFQKMFFIKYFHFTYKLHLMNKSQSLVQDMSDQKKGIFQGVTKNCFDAQIKFLWARTISQEKTKNFYFYTLFEMSWNLILGEGVSVTNFFCLVLLLKQKLLGVYIWTGPIKKV